MVLVRSGLILLLILAFVAKFTRSGKGRTSGSEVGSIRSLPTGRREDGDLRPQIGGISRSLRVPWRLRHMAGRSSGPRGK